MTWLAPHPEGIPLPRTSPASRPFWDACAREELRFERCADCGGAGLVATGWCRHCGGDRLRWERSRGEGALYSWSVVWRPQSPAFRVPYAAAIVRLEEGFDMLANIIGCHTDQLRSGLAVEVAFHAIGDGVLLPYFQPRGDAAGGAGTAPGAGAAT